MDIVKNHIESYSRHMGEPEWMRFRRCEAWEGFKDTPMPDQKIETWRRTDINGLDLGSAIQYLFKRNTVTAGQDNIMDSCWPDGAAIGDCIVQKNGFGLSGVDHKINQSSVIFMDMASALQAAPDLVQRYFLKEDKGSLMKKFRLLHESLWNGGVFLYVPLGTYVMLPVCLLQTWNENSSLAAPHILIVLEESSTLIFYEESRMEGIGQQDHIYLGYTEVYLEKNARLTYVSLNNHRPNVYSFPYRRGKTEEGSELNWINCQIGKNLSKSFTETLLAGSGSASSINELYIGTKEGHIDMSSILTHTASDTKGNIMSKGVLCQNSHSVFQGLIEVGKNAKGADSYLSNKNLIIGEEARADTIPKLEIKTNDVKVSHGVAVGEPEPEHMFYMMSRGLLQEEAEIELVRGFIEPALSKVPRGYPYGRISDVVGGILSSESG